MSKEKNIAPVGTKVHDGQEAVEKQIPKKFKSVEFIEQNQKPFEKLLTNTLQKFLAYVGDEEVIRNLSNDKIEDKMHNFHRSFNKFLLGLLVIKIDAEENTSEDEE